MRNAIRGAITGAEPITTTEAKEQVNQNETYDDTLLASLIVAARVEVEQITRRCLVRCAMTDSLSECDLPGPFGRVPLLGVPVLSLTSLEYIQISSLATVALTLSDYTLRAYDDYAEVLPASGKVWPSDAAEIRITYTCGYLAAAVPMPIKQAIRMRIAQLYADREGGAEATGSKTIMALLTPWRIRMFG